MFSREHILSGSPRRSHHAGLCGHWPSLWHLGEHHRAESLAGGAPVHPSVLGRRAVHDPQHVPRRLFGGGHHGIGVPREHAPDALRRLLRAPVRRKSSVACCPVRRVGDRRVLRREHGAFRRGQLVGGPGAHGEPVLPELLDDLEHRGLRGGGGRRHPRAHRRLRHDGHLHLPARHPEVHLRQYRRHDRGDARRVPVQGVWPHRAGHPHRRRRRRRVRPGVARRCSREKGAPRFAPRKAGRTA